MGRFKSRVCHKTWRRLEADSAVLDGYVPPARAAAYRRSCELWAYFLPVLNRAATFGPPARETFRRQANELVDLRRSGFEWVSITPKIHILSCHAADWLGLFGSLGLLSEQGLEA